MKNICIQRVRLLDDTGLEFTVIPTIVIGSSKYVKCTVLVAWGFWAVSFTIYRLGLKVK